MLQSPTPLPRWMSRLVARRQAPPSSLMHSRIEVCPPELWPSSLSWRGRLQRWLNAHPGWLGSTQRPTDRLTQARDEFQDALGDLNSAGAWDLCERVARARSLRELWHLRLPLYGEVATLRSESEAGRRLQRLNRHFPVRAPRIGHPTLNG